MSAEKSHNYALRSNEKTAGGQHRTPSSVGETSARRLSGIFEDVAYGSSQHGEARRGRGSVSERIAYEQEENIAKAIQKYKEGGDLSEEEDYFAEGLDDYVEHDAAKPQRQRAPTPPGMTPMPCNGLESSKILIREVMKCVP